MLQVAAEVAAPLSQAKKITMASSGKGDVGVSKLTNVRACVCASRSRLSCLVVLMQC